MFIEKLSDIRDKTILFIKNILGRKSKVFIGIIPILVLSVGICISVYAFSRSSSDNTKNPQLEKEEICLTEEESTEIQLDEINTIYNEPESTVERTVTENKSESIIREIEEEKAPEILQNKPKSSERETVKPKEPEQKDDNSSSLQSSQSKEIGVQDSNNPDPYANGSKDWNAIGKDFESIKKWKEIDRFNVDSDSNGHGNYWIIREPNEQ